MSTSVGPHFRELSREGQKNLAGWLVLAQLFPPEPGEDLPHGYGQALQELSSRGRRRRLRQRHQRVQTVRPNNSRQVRVTKAVGQLA